MLLTGGAASGVAAQEAPTPPTPAQEAKPAAKAAPRIEFRGADGKPLPPEIQRELEERFRKNPPPGFGKAPTHAPDDIVVAAQKPRGSVVGNLSPERVFSPVDLRAYGADSIGALLEALGDRKSVV